jgi:competence protein ComEC
MSFRLRLEALKRGEDWATASGQLFVFVSEKRPPQALRYGDAIECSAILRVPPPARNPGTFDWRAWLARHNIHFTATIRKTDVCVVTEVERGHPVLALSLLLREEFERALRLGLEDQPQLAGVLAGMVIGKRSEIPPDTYADFQRTGVFHVFAISGLHVGMVAVIVVLGLRLARVPKRWCGLAAIPLLVLYVFATGARPGAARALVMASVWLVGWALVRPVDSLNNLAAAALLILAWEPQQLFDGGFVLSFSVVVALVVLTPRFEKRVAQFFASDPLVPAQLRSPWRRALEHSALAGTRLVCGSLAAFLGLLPLMAVYFHLFTPVSVLANVLVVPLLGIIISLGMIGLLAHATWPWLTLTLNNANFFLLSAMVSGVDRLGAIPFGHWFVQAPPWWLTAAYYALGVVLLSRWLPVTRKRIVAAVVTPAIGVAVWLAADRPEKVEITVLDLNDGAAIFLNLPGEDADVLIDGGSDWSGARVVAPFLRAQGVDELAAVVLTRGDKQHAAGLSVILREIPVDHVVFSGLPSRSKYYEQWREEVRTRNLPVQRARAGNEILVAHGVSIHALSPPAAAVSNRSADNSLVLLIEYGVNRVLLTSDAGETVERRLLEAGIDVRASVLIKGRHEKESSATDAFLDAVRPALVIQSVGNRSPYRYPRSETRERLQRRGLPLLRTDEAGAVTLRLTTDGYEVRTFLR